MTRLIRRPVPLRARLSLEQAGIHPLLARLFAARGVIDAQELDAHPSSLLPPCLLKGVDHAAHRLADAIERGEKILIIGDYDCDGATATALGVRALHALGANVDYLVPDRFRLGYGLSPELARLASERHPTLIVTVDNGIASVEGVAEAKRLGMAVIVTDHHLPTHELPPADAIVNPNQPGCPFPSKALAGVGVMFYVALAVRAELRRRARFQGRREPNFASLLDLVALGTIADLVPLDRNNRLLVSQGLARIRRRQSTPGILALFALAGRPPERATSQDLGFLIGPRLNAAGRLAEMTLGIECLLAQDMPKALALAQKLDAINRDRRELEADMRLEAERLIDRLAPNDRASLVLYDPSWHPGVIGILAGRIKDRYHRPTFVFAPAEEGLLRGSGRSIPSLHLRDALDLVAKRCPGLLLRFGGHAQAAGLSLRLEDLALFEEVFEDIARQLLAPEELTRTVHTDDALEDAYYNLTTVRMLEETVWGQGFPPPLFDDVFEVVEQKLLKEKHLKLVLKHNGVNYSAIRFNWSEPLPPRIRAVFRLGADDWQGMSALALTVEHHAMP
ncbi:MAG: single-stranded-DNA-specific exonuclease RecJ [Rhodocyclaceae bacterium]|nr:single-stranded-DNA-specific exonuclease RecJ [Rhodocyclaceae bacterium]